ncbi:GAF domain-containing protein [Luteolibacter yonseiensis]|uniref:GAF domain-containing protein n=1 Tax=Luteolibacter yonseiensis TaxID=1144680 RepID=A0A934R3V4_9BACT|nr:GAF domain-containing protein [Luteolibacter yonseiensis]MBK1815806.1 GAF domain-containing protein [Luteolibacter yonseiensis]
MTLEEEWNLESVMATGHLDFRESRNPDLAGEARATLGLMQDLAKAPEVLFPKLTEFVLNCTMADSAGVSLLVEEEGKFVWPAVTGGLAPYIGGGTPMNFGPCGTVLDLDGPVLFIRPERHFTYLKPIEPPLEEVLLVPFHMDGKAVGTVWAVIHEPGKQFESEDRRLLQNLSAFAASAYRMLTESGGLATLLGNLPPPPPVRPMTNVDGKFRFLDK